MTPLSRPEAVGPSPNPSPASAPGVQWPAEKGAGGPRRGDVGEELSLAAYVTRPLKIKEDLKANRLAKSAS